MSTFRQTDISYLSSFPESSLIRNQHYAGSIVCPEKEKITLCCVTAHLLRLQWQRRRKNTQCFHSLPKWNSKSYSWENRRLGPQLLLTQFSFSKFPNASLQGWCLNKFQIVTLSLDSCLSRNRAWTTYILLPETVSHLFAQPLEKSVRKGSYTIALLSGQKLGRLDRTWTKTVVPKLFPCHVLDGQYPIHPGARSG